MQGFQAVPERLIGVRIEVAVAGGTGYPATHPPGRPIECDLQRSVAPFPSIIWRGLTSS